MGVKEVISRLGGGPEDRDSSRREFLQSALAGAMAASLSGTVSAGEAGARSGSPQSSGVLFEGYAVPIMQKRVYESFLAGLDDGQYWLLYVDRQKRLFQQVSADGGRTWDESQPVLSQDGSFIFAGSVAHGSLLHLKSGALGMVYGGPRSRPGRDGTLLYRTSEDGGKSWSAAIVIDPIFSVCQKGTARVLKSGRILAPVFIWVSPAAGPNSEEEANNLTFSWVFYSDDEGRTWQRSLSELFVTVDQGRRGNYDFEEPCLEELKDGSLLMFGRTEFGCFYQTISKDGGVSWSVPQPVPLAASYTPPFLIRIPATGDLLLVWNQASTEEILAGLARHRLSTAITNDSGATWHHFRNLESLDDRTEIQPPQAPPQVYRMKNYHYPETLDQKRYPHAPGCVRICYPTVAFRGNEVAFAYDYGFGGPGDLKEGDTTKVKIVSLDWLYEKTS